MKTIYLMRHGSIEGHEVIRYVGQHDTPLDDKGRRQAMCWGKSLAEIDFSAVYASDLSRCRETASLASGDAELRLVPELREIALGEWQNKTVEHIRITYPDLFEARGRDLAGVRPPGGESFNDLAGRVFPAFEAILEQAQGNVLVVAHSGVNRVIICKLLGIPLGNLFRFGQDYCCLNLIEARNGKTSVKAVNLTFELAGWCNRQTRF